MTHALALSLTAELKQAFDDEGAGGAAGGARALKVIIENESFALARLIPWGSDDSAAALSECTAALQAAEACYLLFRLARGGAWALVSFIPDAAPVREKMLYSSSSATLRRALGGGDTFAREAHWSSLEEASLLSVEAEDQQAIMTATERMAIAEDRLVAMEQAQSGSNKVCSVAGLAFPLVAEAIEQLDGFLAKSIALVVLSIREEQTVLNRAAATATVADLVLALPQAEPCYALFNYAHDHGGNSCNAILFLYVCPEESPVKQKMLHASSKGTILQALESRGIVITKSFEGIEASDLSDELLVKELYPPQAGEETNLNTTKAAPKGGRKLNSRNKR